MRFAGLIREAADANPEPFDEVWHVRKKIGDKNSTWLISGIQQLAAKKAAKKSAGILLYRRGAGGLEVLLAHPGGPYWKSRDLGAWTLPKGEIDEGEDPYDAARREFVEETGFDAPATPRFPSRH